jgi:hypothetical protein
MYFFSKLYICVTTYLCVGDTMGNITLSMPDDVHSEMKNFSEVKWSEVARKAIIEKLETLKIAESLARKSKLKENDVKKFAAKINASATKRFIK